MNESGAAPCITINGRKLGAGFPVYVVAEMSANHGGSLERAREIIRAAKESGADAIKLQTYTPDTLTIDCDSPYFRVNRGTLWADQKLYDLYREAYTPWEWHEELKSVADKIGIDFFSTAFDGSSVEFLESLDVPVHKVASFENIDLPLIEKIARTGKPLIISTGMATLGEIEEAVSTARKNGAREIALLKCTSAYPSPPEEVNLRTIPHMSQAFAVPVGLSDHTLGIEVSIASVVLGACIIERHFVLSRKESTPDSAFSLEPAEFRAMVDAVRVVEKALGKVCYEPGKKELQSRCFRRSLFAVKNIRKGEVFTTDNVRSIRPGYGLPPKYMNVVLGKRAACDIERGTPLKWDLVRG